MRAVVIINPKAGGGRSEGLDACRMLARSVLEPLGYTAEVLVTTAAGHATVASARARGEGVDLVVAWGGDGTVNEVGVSLVGSNTPLGIVPAGSGNGLARDLGIPQDPAGALRVAGTGRPRPIDVGEFGNALFFNVAGVGLDAAVAARLALPNARRGLAGYVQAAFLVWPRYAPQHFRLTGDMTYDGNAWFIAVANSRQYGNGAQIAPEARLDDGRLDIVVVEAQPRWRLIMELPAFFNGTLRPRRGLVMRQASTFTVSAVGPMDIHVDGETSRVAGDIQIQTRPGALLVKSP